MREVEVGRTPELRMALSRHASISLPASLMSSYLRPSTPPADEAVPLLLTSPLSLSTSSSLKWTFRSLCSAPDPGLRGAVV